MKINTLKNYLNKFNQFVKRCFGEDASIFVYLSNAFKFIYCYLKYGTSISDYFELGYYKENKNKSEYATLRINSAMVNAVDDNSVMRKYCDKYNMYSGIKPFLGRKILFTKDAEYHDFLNFVGEQHSILYKPNFESCGHGIEKIDLEGKDLKETWHNIKHCPEGILDTLIVQHQELTKLCSASVNTVRIFTAKVNNKIYYLGACLRIGGGKTFIDNYSSGGLVVSLDLKSGKSVEVAEDMYRKRYSEHPITGVSLKGFQVPHWDKVIALVKDAAIHYKLNYVAWDIAVRENDCVLVESNAYGQIAVIQIAGGSSKRKLCEQIISEAANINNKYKNFNEYEIILCE